MTTSITPMITPEMLMAALHITTRKKLRALFSRDGKTGVPRPDIVITQKVYGWKPETLISRGYPITIEPTPPASAGVEANT